MISGADIQALKDYVKGPSSQNQADTTVRLQVTHSNLKAHFMEIRLDLQVRSKAAPVSTEMLQNWAHTVLAMQMTVGAVKQKLMSHTGSSPSSMQLQLQDETGRLLGQMSNDDRMLGFYSPYDG